MMYSPNANEHWSDADWLFGRIVAPPGVASLTLERSAFVAANNEIADLKERLARAGVEQRRAVRQAVLVEREACAALCDARTKELLDHVMRRQHHHGAWLGASLCADDIRAREASRPQ